MASEACFRYYLQELRKVKMLIYTLLSIKVK